MGEHHEVLASHLTNFAGLTETDLAAGKPFWRSRQLKKGEFFNMQYVVCNDLGLVVKGIFRIYYSNPATDEETNIFFFSFSKK